MPQVRANASLGLDEKKKPYQKSSSCQLPNFKDSMSKKNKAKDSSGSNGGGPSSESEDGSSDSSKESCEFASAGSVSSPRLDTDEVYGEQDLLS